MEEIVAFERLEQQIEDGTYKILKALENALKQIEERLDILERKIDSIGKQTEVTHDIGTQMSNFIPALAFLDQGIGRIKALPFDVMGLLPPMLGSAAQTNP